MAIIMGVCTLSPVFTNSSKDIGMIIFMDTFMFGILIWMISTICKKIEMIKNHDYDLFIVRVTGKRMERHGKSMSYYLFLDTKDGQFKQSTTPRIYKNTKENDRIYFLDYHDTKRTDVFPLN